MDRADDLGLREATADDAGSDHLRVGEDRRTATDRALRRAHRIAVPSEIVDQVGHAAGVDHPPRHRAQLLRQSVEPRLRLDGRE